MPIFRKVIHRGGRSSLRNYYVREGDNRFYRHIFAGISAPSEKPGAIVVVAQEYTLRPEAHLYVIDEFQEMALDKLLEDALNCRSLYAVEDFYGRTTDVAFTRYLSHWNTRRSEKKLKTLQVSPASNSSDGNIAFHVGLLRERLSPSQKMLHLGNSKLLPAVFQQIDISDVSTVKAVEHPLLAALGFAVAAFDEVAGLADDDRPGQGITEYDLFADRDDYSINK